ncbi:MAG: FAD-dependent oxidoreductase [Deltaproteobacteria bacterium]|nr:FAD-dependent oxidoreductase [Deltaproteobacteria bacterium]
MACVSVRDEDGTFNPRYDECELPVTFKADRIIVAVGQTIDPSTLPSGIALSDQGTLSVNPVTLQSDDERVFAGGDAATGPLDIISAITAGKEGAVSIDRYLRGEDLEKERHIPAKSIRERVEMKSLPSAVLNVKKRERSSEVDLGYDRDTAFDQAGRCLQCGTLVPSVVIKRLAPKKQIIPWDATRALELWQKRQPADGEPLPDVFDDMTEITRAPDPDMMGRNKLVLKPKNSEEALFYTTDDE